MAGRTSVTRDFGSPSAPLSDLASKHSRRSSSRASLRTAREPEINLSNLSQSSYSLPPTPLTSTFEESQSSASSAKRRKTQRTTNPEDTVLPSKELSDTDQASAFELSQPASEDSVNPDCSTNSVELDGADSKVQSLQVDEALTPSASKSKPATTTTQTEPSQTTLNSFILKKPQPRRKTLSSNSETGDTKKANSPASTSTMGANMSHTRKLRKSMPDKLNVPEKQGNVSPPSQGSTSLVSTPISTRRNRKSRGTGHTSSRVAKSSENDMDYSTPITAAPRAIATQSNVLTTSSTPDKLTQPETPSSSTTRSRRRERKPTAAITTGHTDQTASTPSTSTKGNEYDQFILTEKKEERHPRMTNTVTLALGRKSLETIINEPPDHISYEHDIAKSEEPTPIHVYGEDNYHFDYDTDMYRNNFGLDGHMDTPASPTSFSTTTSVAARTSGRTRKPTIRALESFESEQRFRRARATSTKPGSSNADAATGRKTRSKSKASQNPMTSVPGPAKAPDMNAIAKQLFDLVAAAMADDFEPAPEAETWLNEKRQEFNAKTTPKTTESPQPAAGVVPDGETTTTSKKQSLSDSVQASQPWTDKDGWTYTGQINEFGEEYVLVPSDFEWYRPNNTYGDKDLPQPPLRLISKDQLEKDRVFGFPPRIGERNLPRDIQAPFMYENIDEEKAKIKAREAARQRGISVHRFMPLAEIEALISHHDNAGYPSTTDSPAVEKGSKEPSRKRRRTEAAATASSSHKPKRRRRETTTAAPGASSAPGSPAPEKPKTLKITLTFSNREVAAGTSTASVEAEPPRKRSRSEFEEGALESSKASLPKARKLAASASQSQKLLAPTPSTPQTATTGITNGHQDTTSSGGPGASEQLPAETPGGRPRRRAAAALIAGFQNHADERARRANARKKTASLGPAVESPLRHAVNPMNLD